MPNLQTADFAQNHKPEALWSLGTTPAMVPQTATLREVISYLGDDSIQGHSCVLVVQGDRLVGLVTDRDAIRMVANGVAIDTPIHERMTHSLTTLLVNETISALDVLDLMRQRQIHHVPLVDTGQRPVRLITTSSLQQTLLPPHVLKLQRVQSRMTTNLVTVHPTDSALDTAALLAEYQVSCIAVVDPTATGVLLGLILRQDVLRFQARQLDLAQLPVRAIMRDPQLCLKPDDSLWLAYQEMSQHRLPCLMVVTPEQQPLGVISQSDLLYSLDLRELQASFSHLWQAFKQSDNEKVEIWKTHSSELERLVQGRTEQLEEQAKCDRLLTTLTQRIHESLDVQDILATTVWEVRQLLQADRALIYRFDTAASGTVAVEAVVPPWNSLVGHTIEDRCFEQHWAEAYRYGRIQAVEDIQRAGLSPCHIDMLAALQIRANLVVPIVCDHQLWGLLIINQCGDARRWRDWEIRLVEQMARSVAIAVRQSELYRKLQEDLEARKQYEIHLQQLNDDLEQRVEARTASLHQVAQKLHREIDQRRETEATLATTNQQLQAVLNAVPAMVSWVSADGLYLGCNHRLAASFSLLPADFIGQQLGFLGEESPFCGFAEAFLASSDSIARQEIQFSMHGVASHWLLVAQKYNQGSAAVIVGLDISDREQAKAALQGSELKFRSLVEQTNDWVWEIDREFSFSYINPRASEILACPAEAILNHQFTDFMADDEAVRFSTILALLVGQRQPFTQLEATCLRPSGEAVILEISGSPIFNPEGEFEGYRGITRDITERKQIEVDIRKALTREKELSDLKTRFISMASHEFRTPLTTILASAETLERYAHKFTPEKQQTVLKRIQTSVHHVIGLLNDVLTVGKAEAGKLSCTLAPIDLHQFCHDLVEEVQFAQVSTASPIEFTATGERSQVLADEKLLRHILLNLLSNAVKYSPEHTPVTFAVTCDNGESVFQVSDRGIGIPPADQAQIFGAFHRANNVGNISGTGLGLVIAKRAAEAHQGQLSFVSEVGLGTTFIVVLPLVLWSDHHG
ncbi:CBS domain-containing protein [Nodosilinea sp. LEGE 07298]|uniref:CBS domain-containing protein n=1 Tax=Nodosilinea sp. LEGE 07298 TaxID=2777970 RepID=UPI00187F5AE3|nr:CBS domain-containing protein [Nodosilinea sp. LEGE 07298]MBE9111782.1 CBS domain-containing protein [Nodosilinea sp. LEGE 07298]